METGIASARSAYPGTLASRLTRARNGRFVGREAEQALWRSALTSESPAFAVLWLHGPGGIGKSALLRCLASIAVELGVAPVSLDAREMPTCDQPFRALLSKALGVDEGADPVPALHAGGRRALLIDTAEILGPVEDWLREEFLPSVPLDCLVVLASRQPPQAAWRADAGWAELLRVVSLRNLSPSDAQRFLLARNVPEARVAALLAATHGHPLALSLVADVISQGDDEELASPASSPDILQALLERFTHDAPDDAHRDALYLAAHARVTDEALLRDLVEPERASKLYAWLGSLSFVEQSAQGLHLHELAAEVLHSELKRRDPARFAAFHRRLRQYHVQQVQTSTGALRIHHASELTWAQRFSPLLGPCCDWSAARACYRSSLAEGDAERIVAHARRRGPETAGAMEYWLKHCPDAFIVIRFSAQRVVGFIFSLVLERLDGEAEHVDALARAAFEYAERTAPLRTGEVVHFSYAIEFDPARESRTMLPHLSAERILRWHHTPRLAWSFLRVGRGNPDWLEGMAQCGHVLGPVARVDAKTCMLTAHDWRREPVNTYTERIAEIELHGVAPRDVPELVVLSEEAFAGAVRQALKDLSRPQLLIHNPLCRSRLVMGTPGALSAQASESGDAPALGAEALRLLRLLETAANSLRGGAKDERLFQVLEQTYLQPALTQDIAAELVGLPFSTYRRYLGAAVARVVAWLWARELNGT
jgi:hypothetical protein